MSLLSNAKQSLIEHAVQLYLDRRSELDFEDYKDHFSDLGDIIASIDKIDLFSNLIKALENGEFEVLGYFPSDEDMLEEFLNSF